VADRPQLVPSLLIGIVFGFLGSMPIAGPVAAIVVSRGLEGRKRAGIHLAAGSATAETIYAFMAFWGVTSVLRRFPVLLPASRLLACAILAALGAYFASGRAKIRRPKSEASSPDGARNALLGFTMTIANPTLIVSWTAAVGVAHSAGIVGVAARNAFPFAAGAGVGIVAWFVLLLGLLGRVRGQANTAALERAVRAMGVVLVLIAFGIGVRTLVKWH